MINRRIFLKSTGMALIAGGFLPDVFVRVAGAATGGGRKTLVVIFQRGAVDGLNVVVPWAERAYAAARPTIAIPRPGREGGSIDLDGFFGLHPAMQSLMPFWRNSSLGFVHAAGSPDATRSHFDAQDFMESGTPGVKTTRDGFLARALERSGVAASPLRAVALGRTMPRILSGSSSALAMASLSSFGVKAGRATEPLSASFESMYGSAVAGELSPPAEGSFEAIRILEAARPDRIQPAHGARYPGGELGESLRQIAQLIRADVGLEVAFTDVGGWDTHAGQGSSDGQLARLLRGYADGLAAFATDLGSRMNEVVVVTISEFGRTVEENGNRGTDHGHGNVISLLGGGVKGGKIYGRWPGLEKSERFEGRDLAVTTDFRDVMGELVSRHLGAGDLRAIFPGYANDARRWLSLLR